MKWLWACLFFGLLSAVVFFPWHSSTPYVDTRPSIIRDSVETLWVKQEAKHDTFRIWLRTASADTLGAILRDRARRPPIFIHDTISDDTMTTTEEVGSSQLCEVAISCNEARSLALRDSALVLLSDSLRGAIAIKRAERDSVDATCKQVTPWKGYGLAFGAGYLAGMATYVVIR